jgi:SAM-dependent methyltransferase
MTRDAAAENHSETDAAAADNHQKMLSMVTGFWVSQIVRAAADLSIAEHVADGGLTAKEIADRESSEPAMTLRLLRACASLGLLTYDAEEGRFSGAPLLDTLRAGSSNSLRDLALAQTAPGHWLTWGKFPETVRKGESQAPAVLGADIFGYFAQQEEEGALFSRAMTNLSSPVIADAVTVIDTTGVGLAVDVGGAHGAFILQLMAANPHLRGLVLDLPHAVRGAVAEARKRGLEDRFSAVTGDFFTTVPAADLYVLKFILHDWHDDACIKILENCRKALNPGGRIVVVEMLLGEIGEPGMAPLMDANMLAMCPGGQERELAEFDTLFAAAGLRRTTATPVRAPYGVIEAVAD